MVAPSLKEVQDGGSISHNIIIYHTPCFVVLYFFVIFFLTTPPCSMSAAGTRMAAVLTKCCIIYVQIWKWPIGVLAIIIQLMTVANENVDGGHMVFVWSFFDFLLTLSFLMLLTCACVHVVCVCLCSCCMRMCIIR